MPKGSITSAVSSSYIPGKVSSKVNLDKPALSYQARLSKKFIVQLYSAKRVRIVQSRRYSVPPLSRPPWSSFFAEFRCRECGPQQAYKSRPRGFFERRVLPLFLLQRVRCERCYHRSYAFFTIPTLQPFQPRRKQSQSQTTDAPNSGSRVA
jgi:hypothetical protein